MLWLLFVVVVIVVVCLFVCLFILFFYFYFYFLKFLNLKFEFLSTGRGSLFSYLLLYMACCIAMVLISMKVCFKVSVGILNFSSNILIEGVCVVALAPVVMTISGSTFHPLLLMLSRSGWYFSIFRVMASDVNLSLQYVNSIN